jgi:polyphosphate glucokinase
MLFLGLGTGLGIALIVNGTVVPMELGHLGLGKRTFEEDLGVRGLERLGRKKWQRRAEAVTERLVSILFLDDVVLGGGNAKRLTRLPFGCRIGDNANAFVGRFRLWEEKGKQS